METDTASIALRLTELTMTASGPGQYVGDPNEAHLAAINFFGRYYRLVSELRAVDKRKSEPQTSMEESTADSDERVA